MKMRPRIFLENGDVDIEGEKLDYLNELHNYLWKFVHIALPRAQGQLSDHIDIAFREMEKPE